MLRISVIDGRTERRLVLEGKLIGRWVAELRKAWKAANGELESRALVVDVGNVCVIGQEGEIALLELMSEGAMFRCRAALGYLAKFDPVSARPLIERAVQARGPGKTACNQSIFQDIAII